MKFFKRIANIVISAAISIGCVSAVYNNCENDIMLISLAAGDYLSAEVLEDGTVEIRKYIGTAETVVIPEKINGRTVSTIGYSCFYNNMDVKKVVLPDTIVEIEHNAFMYCQELESVNFPDSLKTVGNSAFISCSNLTNLYLNNIEKLGTHVFKQCYSLYEMYVSGSLTTVPARTFDQCENMKKLVFEDGVKTIEAKAALDLESVEMIRIPRSVTSIGAYSLGYCSNYDKYDRMDNVTFWVYSNSAGFEYAKNNGFKYEVIDSALSNPAITMPKPVPPPIIRTTTVSKFSTPAYIIGDANLDGTVDSSDASAVLADYSAVQTGKGSKFAEIQKKSADTNGDGLLDASDASEILKYYADSVTDSLPSWRI